MSRLLDLEQEYSAIFSKEFVEATEKYYNPESTNARLQRKADYQSNTLP